MNKHKTDYYYLNKKDLEIIKELLLYIDGRKNKLIISIDGNSGAGKTYYSNILEKIYDCNVIHMDSFYLPKEPTGNDNLIRKAGNIDYIRFESEVLSCLSHENLTYRVFDCKSQEYLEEIKIRNKEITIIEGVYSQSDIFKKYYDLNVFMKCDRDKQISRIREREGDAGLKAFVEKWIPMEESYFNKTGINSCCDILIET